MPVTNADTFQKYAKMSETHAQFVINPTLWVANGAHESVIVTISHSATVHVRVFANGNDARRKSKFIGRKT